MSEYQYHEFQAIDRSLTKQEVNDLRDASTRARITPTSFVNEYSWGSFKGDEDAWMERYFDAFLYLANWGTRIVKLRLPAGLLDPAAGRLYCGQCAALRAAGGKIILTFVSEEEGGDEWDEGEGQLASLIGVRSEFVRGDLRALYLGWLLCAQSGDLGEGASEPPVPAGLGQLSASLASFAEFLRIDSDLIGAAAAASAPLVETQTKPAEIRAWLASLSAAEKDDFLVRLMVGDDGGLGSKLVQRMRRERDAAHCAGGDSSPRRTVAALLRAGEEMAEERRRAAAEKAAREKAKRERAAAAARAAHLEQLAGREPVLWQKVTSLIAIKQPKSYDQVVEILVDLRDLTARKDETGFRRQIEALRIAHAGKRTLIERLNKAGL